MNLGLIKSYTAGAAITGKTLVKFSADDIVVHAAAATDDIVGVAVLDAASGERVDVQLSGIAEVKMAGTVARGEPVTSDASGNGVAPAPAAGVNNRYAGLAMRTTASGDIADVLLVPGIMQGAGLA